MENITMSSSEAVRQIRGDLDLTQIEMGKMLEVSKTAIYKWEKGIIVPTHPHVKKLLAIAKKYKIKVKLEDFFND